MTIRKQVLAPRNSLSLKWFWLHLTGVSLLTTMLFMPRLEGDEIFSPASTVVALVMVLQAWAMSERERAAKEACEFPMLVAEAAKRNGRAHGVRRAPDATEALIDDMIDLHDRFTAKNDDLRRETPLLKAAARLLAAAMAAVSTDFAAIAVDEGDLAFGAASGAGAFMTIDLMLLAPKKLRSVRQAYDAVDVDEVLKEFFREEASPTRARDQVVLEAAEELLKAAGASLRNPLRRSGEAGVGGT